MYRIYYRSRFIFRRDTEERNSIDDKVTHRVAFFECLALNE